MFICLYVYEVPGHLESTLHFVGFERRQKNYEAACAIFDSALSITSLDSSSGPFIAMHYSRFLDRVSCGIYFCVKKVTS